MQQRRWQWQWKAQRQRASNGGNGQHDGKGNETRDSNAMGTAAMVGGTAAAMDGVTAMYQQ